MTDLTITKLGVPSAEMNGTSSLPQLFDVKFETKIFESDLGEDDGLFLNYSRICSAFPYKTQDCYSRELTGEDYDAIVLENEHLRAVFVPGLGGKLWSLYDKDADRELLFANHVFRPAYLALRNAWHRAVSNGTAVRSSDTILLPVIRCSLRSSAKKIQVSAALFSECITMSVFVRLHIRWISICRKMLISSTAE